MSTKVTTQPYGPTCTGQGKSREPTSGKYNRVLQGGAGVWTPSWVDFDFGHTINTIVSPIQQEHGEMWQNRLGSLATW